MKIQNKIILLAVVVLGLFVSYIGIYRQEEKKKFAEIFHSAVDYRRELFQNIFYLEGAFAKAVAFDYTYWDEMVSFLKSHDLEWAKNNLDSSLNTYRVDAMWVVSLDGSLAYSVNRWKNSSLNFLPLPAKVVQRMMGEKKFSNFFISTPVGIAEIHGAPIQPSRDIRRETTPLGYFLVGKVFTPGYLNELAKLNNGQLILLRGTTPPLKETLIEETGLMLFSQKLSDWQGRSVGYLQIQSESAALKVAYLFMRKTTFILFALSLAIFLGLFFALGRWVQRPLKHLTASLHKRDTTLLKEIIHQNDEFGDISRLIAQFFEQQEALKQSRENYRLIFETAASLIFVVDTEGHVTQCNHRCQDLLGYSPEEVLGKSILQFVVAEDRKKVTECLSEIMEQGFCPRKEFRALRKDGEIVDVSVNSSSIRDASGKIFQAMGILEDVTDQKRSAEALYQANEKLAQEQIKLRVALADLEEKTRELVATQAQYLQSEKMSAIGQLSAGVAHEIKNPLGVILLGVECLEQQCPQMNEKGREYIRMVKSATQRADNVIQELLSFSRQTTPNPQELNLFDVVQSACGLVRNTALVRKIKIKGEGTRDLPLIFGNHVLLEQVLLNLLNNAMDALEGRSEGEIILRTYALRKLDQSFESVVLEVTDNGCGMAEEVRTRIFEPFFTMKDQGQGTGLGLSTVFMIVQNHQGTISVKSSPGQGSTFTMQFPVSSEKEDRSEAVG